MDNKDDKLIQKHSPLPDDAPNWAERLYDKAPDLTTPSGEAAKNLLAYGAASLILGWRALFGIFDVGVDIFIRKPVRAINNTFPKTTGAIKHGYNTYNNQFKKIPFPYTAPVLAGATAMLGYSTYEGTIHLMHLFNDHAISSEPIKDPVPLQEQIFFFALPKIAKVALYKPTIITFKATRDGFFDSGLYNNALKPTYMMTIAPIISKTSEYLSNADNWIGRRAPLIHSAKERIFAKGNGEFKNRARRIADNVVAPQTYYNLMDQAFPFDETADSRLKLLSPLSKHWPNMHENGFTIAALNAQGNITHDEPPPSPQ